MNMIDVCLDSCNVTQEYENMLTKALEIVFDESSPSNCVKCCTSFMKINKTFLN